MQRSDRPPSTTDAHDSTNRPRRHPALSDPYHPFVSLDSMPRLAPPVGDRARVMAHELRNPLDGVLRYVNLAARVCESGGPVEKVLAHLSECRAGLGRMAAIIRDVADLPQAADLPLESGSVNDLLDEALRCILGAGGCPGVRVVRHYATGLPEEVPASLFQVFCNLVGNAVEAMTGQGTLTLTTQRVPPQQIVRVADTGPGLPADVDPEDLFQPLITTKDAGRGMGLGLAICRAAVGRLHGSLTGKTAAQGGAVFTIQLPLRFQEGNGPDASQRPGSPHVSTGEPRSDRPVESDHRP